MKKNKLFSLSNMLLIPVGILINVAGVYLGRLLESVHVPLFLDSIGTVLSAALGGYLPGIAVGFLSNIINGLSDPITFYYGILSIMIAAAAAFMSRRRVFRNFGKTALSALIFAAIGGCIGSVLTWYLYGGGIGEGISSPFAHFLNDSIGFSEFSAQFVADTLIDIFDKIVTVLVVYCVLRFLPKKIVDDMHLGFIYGRRGKLSVERESREMTKYYARHSLRTGFVIIVVVSATLLGLLATVISYTIYKDTTTDKYIATNEGAVTLAKTAINGNSINGWLETSEENEEYAETKKSLQSIRDSFTDIEYLYVYQIRSDGCYVVFDTDSPDVEGESLGAVIPFDDAFLKYKEDLLSGRDIEPIISHGAYGWLLTVYMPITDSDGNCTAYAAADIKMDSVIADRYIFIIKIIVQIMGMTILISAFVVIIADKKIITPINKMTEAAEEFAYDSAEQRLKTTEIVSGMNIKTGNEIETLYRALSKTVTDVASYITDINTQSEIISKMQSNIILSFANMVENRDENTGEHIKHTAAIVGIIAREMKREGLYKDILTDKYIENLVRSAPLHDIGKITVSDAVLNKPGKLTEEEFEKMKTHTTAGRKILEAASADIKGDNYLAEATRLAENHHEKWNGKGYPNGIAGEDIPLSARIMAVADVFDALISRRSYKPAYSLEDSYKIIVDDSGKSFDPNVVNAFIRAWDEIKQLAE